MNMRVTVFGKQRNGPPMSASLCALCCCFSNRLPAPRREPLYHLVMVLAAKMGFQHAKGVLGLVKSHDLTAWPQLVTLPSENSTTSECLFFAGGSFKVSSLVSGLSSHLTTSGRSRDEGTAQTCAICACRVSWIVGIGLGKVPSSANQYNPQ